MKYHFGAQMIIVVLVFLNLLSSVFFVNGSGFVANIHTKDGSVAYTSEYNSSGVNDNSVLVVLSIILLIYLSHMVFPIKNRTGILCCFFLSWFVGLMGLLSLYITGTSDWYSTLFVEVNVPLYLWLSSFVLLPFVVVVEFVMHSRRNLTCGL